MVANNIISVNLTIHHPIYQCLMRLLIDYRQILANNLVHGCHKLKSTHVPGNNIQTTCKYMIICIGITEENVGWSFL